MSALARVAGTTFSSLRVRNYRLYFFGQVVSVSGSWMQRVAQSWLVLHLTGSGVALGTVAALQFLPILVFGAWGGVAADRFDKRKLLLVTQAAAGGLALVLGVLTLTGLVNLWMVFALALGLGLVTAVDNPARQAFVMEMVGRDRVTNAVSLNSATFTGARVVGPALAGGLIWAVGTGWCFVLNAISYAAVLAALAAMDSAALIRGDRPAGGRGQTLQGLRYAWSKIEVRALLIVMAVVGTLALNFTIILPLLATKTFQGNAATYGLLFSSMGVGSLVGALVAASRRGPSPALLFGSLFVFGLMMLAAAAAPWLWLEVLALVPLGVSALIFQANGNASLQLRSDPLFRGRVMALYSVVFLGTTPIGAPIVGWVAQSFGPRSGLVLGGAAVIVTAAVAGLWWWRRQEL